MKALNCGKYGNLIFLQLISSSAHANSPAAVIGCLPGSTHFLCPDRRPFKTCYAIELELPVPTTTPCKVEVRHSQAESCTEARSSSAKDI